MNHSKTKTVIRAEFEELRGYSCDQAYQYFKSIGFPEADVAIRFDESIEWFAYTEKIGECRPIYSHKEGGGSWGVELVLGVSNDILNNHAIFASVSEISEIIDELKTTLGDRDYKLISYTWHRGEIEPIWFS